MSKIKRLKLNQNGLYPKKHKHKLSVTYLKYINNLCRNRAIVEVNLRTDANCLAQVFVVAGKPVIVTFHCIVSKYFK
jgi:hypothetical protein